jgi:hypothetical protein
MKDDKKQITMTLRHKNGPIRTGIRQASFWVMWAAMFWINQEYLDSAIPNWALVFLFVVGIFVIALNVAGPDKYDNAEDAKRAVDAFFSK